MHFAFLVTKITRPEDSTKIIELIDNRSIITFVSIVPVSLLHASQTYDTFCNTHDLI